MRTIATLALVTSLATPALVVSAQQHGGATGGAPQTNVLSASDDARARRHFQTGVDDFNTGDYESALDEFKHAYDLSHRPQLFYNLSLTYERLADLPHTIEFLERYLGEVQDIAAADRANLQAKLENLRRRLPSTTGSGATTTTGTTAAGTTGTTATGTGTEATTTGTGTQATGTPTTGTEATTTTGTSGTTTTTATGPTETPAHAAHGGGGGLPMAALVAWIVGGVGLVDFAIAGPLALAGDASLASGCGATRSCSDADVGGQKTLNLLADIGWITALAGAALGTLFFFTMQSHDEAPPAVALAPWLSPRDGAGGLSLTGRL